MKGEFTFKSGPYTVTVRAEGDPLAVIRKIIHPPLLIQPRPGHKPVEDVRRRRA